MSDPAKIQRLAAMLERIRDQPPFVLVIDRQQALALAGQLQLALRHPGNRGATSELARNIIEAIRTAFAGDPDVLAVIQEGFEGCHPARDFHA